ncbi:hypothetical protein X801_03517, partial [Opisthorchis viverrini]
MQLAIELRKSQSASLAFWSPAKEEFDSKPNIEHSKLRMINVFDWYLSHAKQDGDYLIFVHTIKPNKFAKNLSLPMLIGTTMKISASSVEDGKHACRELMCLAKKNDLQAHSYMYVDSDLNAALRKAIKELKPDAVLINRLRFGALKNSTANDIIAFVINEMLPSRTIRDAMEARRRIILPVDNSEHSKRAMDWYFINMQRENDFLIFVHVIEPTRNSSLMGVAIESVPSLLGTVIRVSEESVKDGKLICREAMQKANAHGLKAQSFLYVDTKPGVAILKAIEELKGDGYKITDTFNHVHALNTETMPIELAPEAVEAPRRIILPIDNSEHSKRAIDWYFANVQRENDFLLFVHVVEPTRNNSSVGVAIESAPSLLGTVLRVSEESVKEGKQICREAMQKASAHDVKGQSFLYVDTKPAAAILRAISELKGDLVIIGSRGIG